MNEPIPFADPAAGVKALKTELLAGIERVIDSGRYILGPEVEAFETEFAEAFEAPFCTGVGSGTDALELALRAVGVGQSDHVITVSHTAVATVAAIEHCGAIPALVDIDPDTMTMSPDCLEAALDHCSRHALPVRAILPVHLYGQPAGMKHICRIAASRGIPVVEDCAQAHGAHIDGQPVGAFGDAAGYSFYPTKNIGAIGDGGAVTTSSEATHEAVRRLRQYGWTRRYISTDTGINSRLDELQAAILRIRLAHFKGDLSHRRALGRLYSRSLEGLALKVPPTDAGDLGHAFHLYVIRTPRRDDLQAYLTTHGVGTAIHYPLPVHQQPAYRQQPRPGDGTLPVTEAVCSELLSLPMYPELAEHQVSRICRRIDAFFSGHSG